jgi:hypothetical protein
MVRTWPFLWQSIPESARQSPPQYYIVEERRQECEYVRSLYLRFLTKSIQFEIKHKWRTFILLLPEPLSKNDSSSKGGSASRPSFSGFLTSNPIRIQYPKSPFSLHESRLQLRCDSAHQHLPHIPGNEPVPSASHTHQLQTGQKSADAKSINPLTYGMSILAVIPMT